MDFKEVGARRALRSRAGEMKICLRAWRLPQMTDKASTYQARAVLDELARRIHQKHPKGTVVHSLVEGEHEERGRYLEKIVYYPTWASRSGERIIWIDCTVRRAKRKRRTRRMNG